MCYKKTTGKTIFNSNKSDKTGKKINSINSYLRAHHAIASNLYEYVQSRCFCFDYHNRLTSLSLPLSIYLYFKVS